MDIRTIDPESRDYDLNKDLKVDPRFKQCAKEAFIGSCLFICHAIFLVVNLINGAGAPDPLAKMMFGLPQWLVIQLCEFVVYLALVFLLVDKVYKNMDITPYGKIHDK